MPSLDWLETLYTFKVRRISRKVSWWNLEKKREKNGKKILSEYHENFVQGQFGPCGFKKIGPVTTSWRPGAREQK